MLELIERRVTERPVSDVSDVDGDLLDFINPSLTLFGADEEAVTSCDVTSEMTLGDDVVDVTLLSEDELRIKTEPVDMYDDSLVAMTAASMHSGETSEQLYM